MSRLPLFLAAVLCTAPAASLRAQSTVSVPAASPRATVMQTVGITPITVDYSRPSVNGRPVWGPLVPYGMNNLGFGTATAAPWRAGADMNTVVTFAHDVQIGGQPLKAGSYGLFMVPTESGQVTVILSHDHRSWGSFFYDASRDAARFETKWEDAPHTEQLAYEFTDVKKGSAVLALRWEKKRIPMTITVDTDAHVVASLKEELRGDKQFQYQNWLIASTYLQNNNLDLELALQWAETAISGQFTGQRTFPTLSNKAVLLARLGRPAEAKPLLDELVATGTVFQLHALGRQLIVSQQPQLAMEVFQTNAQRHPDTWPVHYGLARGHSALGNYAAALEALLLAEKQIPAGDLVNPPAIKANLEKLRQGQDIN